VGGVGFFPHGVEYFGLIVPQCIVDSWKSRETQEQTIGQAKLFPVATARWTWAAHLKGRRAIFFVDNEAARLGLVKAYSPVLQSLRLIQDCLAWDRINECIPWYARVPSPSNCADDPSRMSKGAFLENVNAVCVSPVFEESFRSRYYFEWGDLQCLH